MKKNIFLYAILLFVLAITSSYAQSTSTINLSKITFSTGRCNGTCPIINLEIDSAKNIIVTRVYFKNKKGDVDSLYSGSFKGELSKKDYNKLIKLLQTCDINTLEFPKLRIYDKAITSIAVYYNGKIKKLTSASPPAKAKELIAFLDIVANDTALQRANEKSNN
jgi:hypothetical protein